MDKGIGQSELLVIARSRFFQSLRLSLPLNDEPLYLSGFRFAITFVVLPRVFRTLRASCESIERALVLLAAHGTTVLLLEVGVSIT